MKYILCLFELFIKILAHSRILSALAGEEERSLSHVLYHLITEDPHVNPPPNATSITMFPLRSRPSFLASSIAIGTEQEDVFPYLSMFTKAFSIGNPSFSMEKAFVTTDKYGNTSSAS